MPIMSALPSFDDPFSHPSISRMLLTAIPANSAVHGRSEMKNERMAAAIMNASTVAREFPLVSLMRVNTIFVGIFVFRSAAVMPNEAMMKKITLLTNPDHTPALYSMIPKTGMSTMMIRPEMATGIGSVTQRKMPATMRASDIFPASPKPSGVGPSHAAAMRTAAIPMQSARFMFEGPPSAVNRFSFIADRSPSTRRAIRERLRAKNAYPRLSRGNDTDRQSVANQA